MRSNHRCKDALNKIKQKRIEDKLVENKLDYSKFIYFMNILKINLYEIKYLVPLLERLPFFNHTNNFNKEEYDYEDCVDNYYLYNYYLKELNLFISYKFHNACFLEDDTLDFTQAWHTTTYSWLTPIFFYRCLRFFSYHCLAFFSKVCWIWSDFDIFSFFDLSVITTYIFDKLDDYFRWF